MEFFHSEAHVLFR